MQENSQTFYHILPNGVKIVHRHTTSPVAYVGVMVGVGTRDELPKENGMAHYIEHCVFKGTTHHSAREIIRHIEGIGGEINAYTTKEETTFYAATMVEHVASTLRLISELVTCPTFPKAETDKELAVIYDEIESYNDSPSELIYDDFEALVFEGQPLAMPILGTKKSLRAISRHAETPINWMRTHYAPARMVVFCQGDVKPDKIFRLAEKEFGQLTPYNTNHTDRAASTTTTGSATLSFHKHTHQAHIMLGNTAYPLGHERQLALYLLNNILGGGSLNSRLNISLREKRGLVYTVDSIYTPLSDTGYWCTYFACDREDIGQCESLVKHELDKLATTPLSDAALRNALQQLRGQMAVAAQNQESTALSMAKSMLYFNSAPTWQQTFQKIAQTDPKTLLEISQQIFTANTLRTLRYE